jgi:RNA polymerase sigma factor (sigma-70 family)
VLRRSELTKSEKVLLGKIAFPEIMRLNYQAVWKQLRRRRLEKETARDLVQEVYLDLWRHLCAHGFPDRMAALLHTITEHRILNHVRNRRRAPVSVCLPSSGSALPESEPDVDRAVDLRAMAEKLRQLKPEHQDVVDAVILHGLTPADAAIALDIPEGTVRSRLIRAKQELMALAEVFLPESQRAA